MRERDLTFFFARNKTRRGEENEKEQGSKRGGGKERRGWRTTCSHGFKTYGLKASTPVYHPAQLSLRQPFPSLSRVISPLPITRICVLDSETRFL